MNGKVFTTGEAARMLACSPRTLKKWNDEGLLSGYSIPGKRRDRRFTYQQLAAFAETHQMPLQGVETKVVLVSADETLIGRVKQELWSTTVVVTPSAFAAGGELAQRKHCRTVLLLDMMLSDSQAILKSLHLTRAERGKAPFPIFVLSQGSIPENVASSIGVAGNVARDFQSGYLRNTIEHLN